MRQEDQGTFQMLWDCPRCDTKGLLGLDHRHCPNCGAAQDPTRRYFPSEAQKVEVKDHQFTGADWVCSACSTPSGAAAGFCPNCGGPKDGAKEAKRRADQVAASPEAFAADSSRTARQELSGQPRPPAAQPTPPAGKKRGCLSMLAVGVILLLLVVGLVKCLKKEASVEVASHTWTRTIEIEKLQEVRESAWRDEVPGGARSINCSKEVRSHKQVEDGEECNTRRVDKGDGTFKQVKECKPKYRDEPVYDSKCSFLVEQWKGDRKAEASGSSLAETPAWPPTNLTREGSCLGCEREGSRTEVYTVHFTDSKDKAKTYECKLPEAQWKGMAVGTKFKSSASMITGNLDCEKLAPL